MPRTLEERLARLYLHETCYELIGVCGDRKVLACYTNRKSRSMIDKIISKQAEAWVKLTGVDRITYEKKAADGATIGAWRIVWSGRTERQALIEGEYPFILRLPETQEIADGERVAQVGS